MATGARVALAPAPFTAGSAVSVFPLYATVGSPGIDAAGAGGVLFATSWTGNLGVLIPNPNGQVWLYYTAGGTAPGVYQVLVGQVLGSTGQVVAATAETGTLAATTSGWLGPWSPATYSQVRPTTR